MSYSTCRSCGAKIIWIELESGKMHPCDPEEYGAADLEPDMRVVVEDGRILSGEEISDAELSTEVCYVSHFSTCPDADDWRKKK